VPTSGTLLGYVKGMMSDEILAKSEVQAKRCIKALKKGLSIKNVALAFDWHNEYYYGKQVAGVVGAQLKDLLRLPNCEHPHAEEEANALPLESKEGLQELVLDLLERIKRLVKGIAYVAFNNGFQDKELIEQLLEHKPIHPSPAQHCKA